jgi:hypothetical protein
MSIRQNTVRYRAALIGTVAGVAAGLLAGFNIQSATSGMLLGLAVIGAFVGALAGYFGVNVPTEVAPDSPATPPRRAEANRSTSSTAITQTALASRVSSANLRPIRITSHTAPMSPPGLELRLMVSDFDNVVRTAFSEGWYGRQSFEELVKRVQEEALSKAPVQGLTSFPMTGYRSLDTVDERGMCETGWHFVFEEGDHGLRCSAIVTPLDLVMSFIGVPTWHRPASDEIPLPADLLTAFDGATAAPADLLLHVILPSAALIWSRAGAPPARGGAVLADVNSSGQVVLCNEAALNSGGVASAPMAAADPSWSLATQVPAEWVALVRSVDGESAVEMPESRAREIAACVYATHFAASCGMIEKLFVAVEGSEERIALLEVLARIPTVLAISSLYRLRSQTRSATVRERLDTLLRRRRRYDMTLLEHPLDSLNFARLRELCGYSQALVVSLRASFSPMPDLVEPLQRLGLQVLYANVLSGAPDTPMTVRMQWEADASTHVLLASTPLPMPCHVLHISGPSADAVREAVLASGLTYSLRQIQDDACSGKPNLVYRASLYLAALGEPCRKGAAPILEAFPRSGADPHMRRAFIRALEFSPEPGALELLAGLMDDEDEAIRETVGVVAANLRAKGVGEGSLWKMTSAAVED